MKEELKKLQKELKYNCISLEKFLINYCGIYCEEIHNIKITHQDIKELIPELKRVSFESLLQNKNSFYNGSVIPVKDCLGNIVPYINPKLEIEVMLEFDCEIDDNVYLNEIELDDDLRTYELVKLCRVFKEHGMKKQYRTVHKLLKEAKNQKEKEYKYKKKNLKLERRDNNDEY